MANKLVIRVVADKGESVRVDLPKSMLISIELGLGARLAELRKSLAVEQGRVQPSVLDGSQESIPADPFAVMTLRAAIEKLLDQLDAIRTLSEEVQL